MGRCFLLEIHAVQGDLSVGHLSEKATVLVENAKPLSVGTVLE